MSALRNLRICVGLKNRQKNFICMAAAVRMKKIATNQLDNDCYLIKNVNSVAEV
jgi:hypothetical protein